MNLISKWINTLVFGAARFILYLYRVEWVRIQRKRVVKSDFAKKRNHLKRLTADQQKEIISYWAPLFNAKKEMHWFEFYNNICVDKATLKYYVPDSVYYIDFDRIITNSGRAQMMDDKNLYDLLFHDINRPRCIARKTNGTLLDSDYQIITADQAYQLCKAQGRIIAKEARVSAGGKGVKFMDFNEVSREQFIDWTDRHPEFVIQEIIEQHETLSSIHAASINTIRIMTMLHDGKVIVLSSVLRMGKDGAKVDNASSGGIVCGIDDKGCLKEYAYDVHGDRWSQHPQGAVFKGIPIPGFDKCRQLVIRLAGRLCNTSPLVSWDLAVGKDGEPILIECNMTFGQLDFHQMCNGPIFGDRPMEFLSTVLPLKH